MFTVVFNENKKIEKSPILKKDIKDDFFKEDINEMKKLNWFQIGKKWYLNIKEEVVWRFSFQFFNYVIMDQNNGNLVLIFDNKQNIVKTFINAEIIERNYPIKLKK